MRKSVGQMVWWSGRVVIGVLVVMLGYAAAGLAGGAWARNAGWTPPERGIAVYVADNGVHTDLVLPKRAGGIDWRGVFPASDLGDPRYGGYDHVAIGWGDRRFYLETPTWADVRPVTVAAAAIGSERTVLHVAHVPAPPVTPDIRRILLRPAEYARLAAFVRASIGAPGDVVHGYGPEDAFYPARGRYNALRTCNEWIGAALREAGVRMGAWTPFPVTVTWWLA